MTNPFTESQDQFIPLNNGNLVITLGNNIFLYDVDEEQIYKLEKTAFTSIDNENSVL